ncbi:MAG TPA: DUF1501 domain-containing protein [Caulobacteraceae bacterium]|jgi:uncharacterized protein (DUF1501 family)|nr:DUF1501 domain-containing protein [Caulobacteraceae bacterium]
MTCSFDLNRRSALLAGAGLGLSVTFLGRQAFAASEGDMARRKLVVFVCRGAMDGLSVSPPIGDPNYAGLRGDIAIAGFGQPNGALPLDGTFGLHPKLAAVHALALKGQARIAPAIATPDRARSHFEAQDVLETGVPEADNNGSGWLNRAMEALSGARKVDAISVGAQQPLILRGKLQAASWSPGGYKDRDARLPAILTDLYAGDPLLSPALASGLETEAMAKVATAMPDEADPLMTGAAATADPMAPQPPIDTAMQNAQGGSGQSVQPYAAKATQQAIEAARKIGVTLANFMTEPNGPQIAAVSIDGFDTHANQGGADGQLANRLHGLDAVLDGLSTGLGPEWNNTVVVVATEFGRTARINGTKGTDHGTASTALVLGGALKRGGIIGDWPTLQQAKLFENRDTAPTMDMRALFKGVLAEQLGVDRRALDTTVFPGSASVAPATGIVA